MAAERYMKGPEYIIHLDDQTAYVPEELLSNIAVYDHAMELAKEFARQNKGKPISLEIFLNFLKAQKFAAYPSIARKLYGIAEILKVFIDKERDTIWAFVLKNRFKPLFFKNRFDFVMGNPPWIAFRHLEPAYQDFAGLIANVTYLRRVAFEYPAGEFGMLNYFEIQSDKIFLFEERTRRFVQFCHCDDFLPWKKSFLQIEPRVA